MNSKSIKILFVEGDTREVDVVKNMIATFFCSPRIDFKVIPIAVGQNIYMLWNLLKEDDFDSDIIELIRENIPSATKQLEGCTRQNVDEVYLFFDLDKQQDNLPSDKDPNEVLQMMLETFDNETGNGKLYISYPMVEALRDFRAGYCQPFYKCVLSEEDIAKDAYKTQTGSEKNIYVQTNKYKHETWTAITETFALRLRCLFDNEKMDFDFYRENISLLDIWEKEKEKYLDENKIFVLSAFPEFLLDYFPKDFFTSHTRRKKRQFLECPNDKSHSNL